MKRNANQTTIAVRTDPMMVARNERDRSGRAIAVPVDIEPQRLPKASAWREYVGLPAV
jgi:hypothetical protein